MALLVSGCETGSALRNVEVTYRFENVRRAGGLDEWVHIRRILEEHSVRPVTDNQKPASTTARNDIRTVQAQVVLDTLADLDKVQADLEELSQTRVRGERIQFTLVGLTPTYRSNAVAAVATAMVSGVATGGYLIKLYTEPGGEPLRTVAGGGGLWSVRLTSVPDDRFVYGVSLDPAARVAPRFFRVNVSTLRQEAVDEDEFLKRHPQATDFDEGQPKPPAASKPPPRSEPRRSGENERSRGAPR